MTNTKSEIMSAIARTDDTNLKMILLLMLGIMEEIGGKIDRIYTDKEALRESVLNGHAGVHHDDHEWIKERRADYQIRMDFMKRVEPVITWAEAQMQDQKDTKQTVKTKVIGNLVDISGKVLWAIVGVAAYVVLKGV